MLGGRLLALDHRGHVVKRYQLLEGLAMLGSDIACDIRVLRTSIGNHHASIVWLNNQALVQAVEDHETFLNGRKVSEAVLRHKDVITLGDRSFRWEYNDLTKKRGVPRVVGHYGAGCGRGKMHRRSLVLRPMLRERAQHLALQLNRRATISGNSTGKQVAIVQPQRRETGEQTAKTAAPSRPNTGNKRPRHTISHMETSVNEPEADRFKRKSAKISLRNSLPNLQNTTKATIWIESRKSSPRKNTKPSTSVQAYTESEYSIEESAGAENSEQQVRSSPRKTDRVQTPTQIRIANVKSMFSSARKSTPLRMAVLRKAQSAQKVRVTKIEAPSKIDHTKQAALLLMTGHTPKPKISVTVKRTPHVVKKQSPIRNPPKSGRKSSGRRSKENNTPSLIGATPKRASTYENSSRKSNRNAGSKSVTLLDISDSEAQNSTLQRSRRSGQRSPLKSPPLLSPKKSALKDPKRNSRKKESIKFDLSNLENLESSDIFMVTDTTKQTYDGDSASDTEMTLHYSDVTNSPSPRRPIHSRSSKILERTLGSKVTLSPPLGSAVKEVTETPESPGSRKSSRGSLILQNALQSSTSVYSEPTTYSRRTSKTISETNQSETSLASAFKTHTLSPRSTRNDIESYSIVDLVSVDSNDTVRSGSLYNSVGSSKSSEFGTPQNSIGRKTRSTIDNNFLESSTPYVGKVTRAANQGLSEFCKSSLKSQSSPDVSQANNKMIQSFKSTISTRRSKSLTTPENTQKHISLNSTRISRRSRSRSRINDSDLLFLDVEESDSSPKTSRRVTKASQNFINTLTETCSPLQHEGTITPEDRCSPQDFGTPVLSIQSLLNSNQSSMTSRSSHKNARRSYNRKTIGVLSENRKRQSDSKSRSLSAKKAILRLSKDSSDDSVRTDEGAPVPDNEETVTPKSTVKLIPEAVKNKHSTVKKSQSKRSIIDDLNQSDIGKQFFNSPVKRKLSKSMTELSRKRLFEEDDDDIIVKRPTRNTVALTGRTPDNSILLDQTEAYTPERFVSPINTPSNSPDLSGIKRLFRKNTPENDLRDVRGVKELLRTPGARKSVRNDLTNVSGVKRLQRKSPKNDLTDVRGVRKMFKQGKQSSAFNVSGVQELFNTSNQSYSDTDRLFDQLLGRPPIRAVYSKTFIKRPKPKIRTRQTQSLHNSIDIITNNVEEWLQKELQKRFNKEGSKPSASNSLARELNRIATDTVEGSTPIRNSRSRKSTLIKSIIGEQERKRSASEIYSARKLPIKKRSVVERSLDESKNANNSRLPIKKRVIVHSTPVKGWNSLMINASDLGRVSPIAPENQTRDVSTRSTKKQKGPQSKKLNTKTQRSRGSKPIAENPTVSPDSSPNEAGAVAKNSPEIRNTRNRQNTKSKNMENTKKGRKSLTITKKPPVMGPKSPYIKSPEKRTRLQQQDVKVQTLKTTRAKVQNSTVSPDPSPNEAGAVAKNSPEIRNTRNRQNTKSKNTENTKKGRKSLTITKKPHVMGPKSPYIKSPEKRTRRQQQDVKVQTPKTARAKVQKGTVVVIKQSPILKPNVTKKSQQQDVINVRVTRARKTNESLKGSDNTRTRNNKGNVRGSSEEENAETRPTKRGGRTTVKGIKTNGKAQVVTENQADSQLKVTRQTRRTKVDNIVTSPKSQPVRPNTLKGEITASLNQEVFQKRGRKRQALELSEVIQPSTRKRQTRTAKSKTEETIQTVEEDLPKTRRGRPKKIQPEAKKPDSVEEHDDEKPKKLTRLQKAISVEPNIEIEAKTRNQRHVKFDNVVSLELDTGNSKGRKRKTVIEEIYPPKVTRSRNETTQMTETSTVNSRQKRTAGKDNKIGIDVSKREMTMDRSAEVAENRRGGRAAAVATEQLQETNKRKRKAKEDTSLAQDTTEEPTSRKTRKMAKAAEANTPLKTRAQRTKDKKETQVTNKPASRTRKK